MKTTPIYILLLIFFLNFDLAWGLTIPLKKQNHLLLTQYSISEIDKSNFQSLNLVYYLNSDQIYRQFNDKSLLLIHRVRLNIGLTKVLAEADYDLGLNITNLIPLHIMPYVTMGTNIYSFGYGFGLDIVIPTRSRFAILGNLNYRTTEKLFGHTDAQQWYQSGFGAKIGVGFIFSVYED